MPKIFYLFCISWLQITYQFDLKYPNVRRDETVKDNFFGTVVSDPYGWLENPDSNETKAFVNAENAISEAYINGAKSRDKIRAKVTKMWSYPVMKYLRKTKNGYICETNNGTQNQAVVYKQKTLDSKPQVLLDPNLLSSDGTIAIERTDVSEDGNIMAYGLTKSGSDFVTFHFRNVETGEDLSDVLKKTKFSYISWTHDNKGVFYSRLVDIEDSEDEGTGSEAFKGHKLYYHRIGTPQSEDILCVEFPKEHKYLIETDVSECGRWLILQVNQGGNKNLLYFADLQALSEGIKGKINITEIVGNFEATYKYVTNIGPKFIIRTNKDAPNFKLIVIDFNNYKRDNWKTLVPEHPSDVLEIAKGFASDKIVISYVQHVKNIIKIYSVLDGSFIEDVTIPMGSVQDISTRLKETQMFFTFTSFFIPNNVYFGEFKNNNLSLQVHFRSTPTDLDYNMFELKQIFYPSKDGAKVPMYIIHKKGISMNGTNPCLLHGYGGFGVSILPYYSVATIIYMKYFNGVYVIANIRGGGEYGEKWHNDGRLSKKQNVFDDFQAAGEYLIRNKYTNNKLLATLGGSNGGLLTAVCANQRPDLFGATIIVVGVLDMLRFHKFTIGSAWMSDYGNPEKEEDFQYIYKYSPLHNIRVPKGQYPATLVTTADHDDRVVPSHSYKFIATLQYTLRNHTIQKNPLLLKVDTKAGHGAGKPKAKLIEDVVDILSFLERALKLKFA